MTTAAFNTKGTETDNKIPDTRGLAKKTDYDTTMNKILNKTPNHDKFITTAEFNNFSGEVIDAKPKQTNLISKAVLNKKLKLKYLIQLIF